MSDTLIRVVCWDGSEAEATSPEGAVLAARTLWDEALALSIPAGVRTGYPVVTFIFEDGSRRSTSNRIELG